MATEYYSLNRGQNQKDVAKATVQPTADIYVAIDLTKSLTKEDVILQLEKISNYVISHGWPP